MIVPPSPAAASRSLLLASALVPLLLSACEPKSRIISWSSTGVGGGDDSFSVLAGSGSREDGQPGVVFTSFHVGSTRHLAYVLIVKRERVDRPRQPGTPGRWAHSSGDEAASRVTMSDPDTGLIEFEIEHKVVRSQDASAGFSETLSINGQPVDPNDGRVFLVHRNTDEIDWTPLAVQPAVKLPLDLDQPTVKSVAADLLEEVSANAAAREFIED